MGIAKHYTTLTQHTVYTISTTSFTLKQRQPRGSRASRTSRTTSELSTTWHRNSYNCFTSHSEYNNLLSSQHWAELSVEIYHN